MQKPVNECVDACFGYESAGSFSYLNSDLLGVVKVYCVLKGYSLVSDNTFRKYILEGLNRKAGKLEYKNFKEMSTEHICFTELGLAYYCVYKEEVEYKGINWSLFESKVMDEPGFKKSLLQKIRNFNKLYGGLDSVVIKAPDSPIMSVSDLKELSIKSFEGLEKLCREMAKASNNLIQDRGLSDRNDDISNLVLDTHKKYYSTASMNDKELLKLVCQVKQEINDAIVILGLIERLN